MRASLLAVLGIFGLLLPFPGAASSECESKLLLSEKYVFTLEAFRGLRGKRKIVALYPISEDEFLELLGNGELSRRSSPVVPDSYSTRSIGSAYFDVSATNWYGPLFKFGLNQKVLLEMGGVNRKDSEHDMGRKRARNEEQKTGWAAAHFTIRLNKLDTIRAVPRYWYETNPCVVLGLTAHPFSLQGAVLDSMGKWWTDDSLVGVELSLVLPRRLGWADIGAVFATNGSLKNAGLAQKTQADFVASKE